MLRFSSGDSNVDIPGEILGDEYAGTVFRIRSNPDSNITLEMWYPDGTRKFHLYRDRAIAYDAFGRQVTTIESNRYSNFESGMRLGMEMVTTGVAMYAANRSEPTPSRTSEERMANLQAQLNMAIDAIAQLRAALMPTPEAGGDGG